MDRTSSASSTSSTDGADLGANPRKRRSPSSDSAISDVSEPNDQALDDFAVLSPLVVTAAAADDDGGCWRTDALGGNLASPQLLGLPSLDSMAAMLMGEDDGTSVSDFGNLDKLDDLPALDNDALTALPSGPPEHLALPVFHDSRNQQTLANTSSEESNASGSGSEHLGVTHKSKKERNREAAVRFRKNRKGREQTAKSNLRTLTAKVAALEEEKQQMRTQLEQFQALFSKHNMQQLSSTVMSGLCMVCAVVCVFAPQDSITSGMSEQHRVTGSPTGRSLLSFTPAPAPFLATPEAEITATDLLLSCLGAASSRVFQHAM